MPCYRPIKGWRSREVSHTGRRKIVFNQSQGYKDLEVMVPCGQCIGCKLDKSRQWAIRCVHESKTHVENCFITLTYDPEHLPDGNTLVKDDLTKFFKRLRERIKYEQPGREIRYFACGEYGEIGKRPHYHAIVFGYDFQDKEFIGGSGQNKLYTSDMLSDLWKYGFSTVGSVSFDSAAYVARYCTKKITGVKAEEHYNGREPEYCVMSRRPGIGNQWFQGNYGDFERAGYRIILDNGKSIKAARYYENIYQERIIDGYNGYKSERKRVAKSSRVQSDNTAERLEVKERLQEYSLKQQNGRKL